MLPPAPPEPHSTQLSAFNGLNPNGTWNLFVADDAAGDAGSIAAGWRLELTTAPTLAGAAGRPDPGDPEGRMQLTWHTTAARLELELTGAPLGSRLVLEESSDLVNWMPLPSGTFVNAPHLRIPVEVGTQEHAARFLRARVRIESLEE